MPAVPGSCLMRPMLASGSDTAAALTRWPVAGDAVDRVVQWACSKACITDLGIRPRADTGIPLSAAHWRIARI